MKTPVRIVVVGSSNTDLVLTCDRLPKPGETLLGGELARFGGGKGANQAVAAARAEARVAFVGARGADDFGVQALQNLRAEGIDTRYFTIHPGSPSGVAIILLGGRNRQNQIVVARSANDQVGLAAVRKAAVAFANAHAVVAQLEIPLAGVMAAAKLAQRARTPFILNPAPAQKLPAALLRQVDTLVPNEHEAALLTGQSDPARAAKILLRKGCRRVVVTLGAKGALLADASGVRHLKALKVKPVDTVGAGDCFTAWLAVGLAEGLLLDAAAQRAMKAASIAVTRPGAQPGMPYRREVDSKSKLS
jgi:ribokinase